MFLFYYQLSFHYFCKKYNKMKNLNGSTLQFEQDNMINFEESTHTYTDKDGNTLTSVSNVIRQFFKEFDAEYWSLRKCYGNENAAAALREEWECKGCFATQAGTFLHLQIENYLNGKTDASMRCNMRFEGEYLSKEDTTSIEKGWNHFLKFKEEVPFTPFRTEWKVCDFDRKIAGTIDLLCSNEDGTYEMFDWKRSSKIDPDEINKWDNGINGLEHLTDTSYIHYCLQQNLYRYILEKNYGLKISKMNLVILHPLYDSYRVVTVPRMEKEVEIILNRFCVK